MCKFRRHPTILFGCIMLGLTQMGARKVQLSRKHSFLLVSGKAAHQQQKERFSEGHSEGTQALQASRLRISQMIGQSVRRIDMASIKEIEGIGPGYAAKLKD